MSAIPLHLLLLLLAVDLPIGRSTKQEFTSGDKKYSIVVTDDSSQFPTLGRLVYFNIAGDETGARLNYIGIFDKDMSPTPPSQWTLSICRI